MLELKMSNRAWIPILHAMPCHAVCLLKISAFPTRRVRDSESADGFSCCSRRGGNESRLYLHVYTEWWKLKSHCSRQVREKWTFSPVFHRQKSQFWDVVPEIPWSFSSSPVLLFWHIVVNYSGWNSFSVMGAQSLMNNLWVLGKQGEIIVSSGTPRIKWTT